MPELAAVSFCFDRLGIRAKMTKIIEKILSLRQTLSRNDRSFSSSVSRSSSTDDLPSQRSNISPPPPPSCPPPSPSPYYSFEFFPPKTEAGLDNLYERIDRMKDLDPLFIDVTWGACGGTERETVSIATYAQQYCGLDVLMHLTATGLNKAQIKRALEVSC